MKRFALPLLFCIFLVLAFFRASLPSFCGAVQEHNLFQTKKRVWKLPGLSPRRTNDLLAEHSPFLTIVVEAAYSLRLSVGMIPAWIDSIRDPVDPNFMQLVVRDEIADEFTDQSMEARMHLGSQSIVNTYREFTKVTGRRLALVMVPTKVASNGLQFAPSRASPADAAHFGNLKKSELVGAFKKQLKVESELEQANVNFISLIAPYRELQKRGVQIYPRSETHWTADVKLIAAQKIIERLRDLRFFSVSCIVKGPLPSPVETNTYWGDLFNGLGWQERFSSSKKFATEVNIFRIAPTEKFARECPPLMIAGSSYSVNNIGGLTFADALKTQYLGKVENRSEGSKALAETLRALQKTELPANAIVLWEFPFRYLKRDI